LRDKTDINRDQAAVIRGLPAMIQMMLAHGQGGPLRQSTNCGKGRADERGLHLLRHDTQSIDLFIFSSNFQCVGSVLTLGHALEVTSD
jgi:hypothetical protein